MSENSVQRAQTQASPRAVFDRMVSAANRHDLEAMVACYAPDYRSEQPFHPERNFIGPEGVRKNWSFFFTTMPDYQMEVLNETIEGDTIWAELHFHGTQLDGTKQSKRAVSLLGVQGDQFSWTRLYIE